MVKLLPVGIWRRVEARARYTMRDCEVYPRKLRYWRVNGYHISGRVYKERAGKSFHNTHWLVSLWAARSLFLSSTSNSFSISKTPSVWSCVIIGSLEKNPSTMKVRQSPSTTTTVLYTLWCVNILLIVSWTMDTYEGGRIFSRMWGDLRVKCISHDFPFQNVTCACPFFEVNNGDDFDDQPECLWQFKTSTLEYVIIAPYATISTNKDR